ncbi:lactoylglutathione lyase [Pararhizobium polonicum]|jgi:catechol 2,3-dioxygenase-like lactoylglutathione lyase family enzyme|uniref:Lactoylglutathione lyase n=1 Tax=Pararhizobium polonicum TaxID=1612624 RepID=A0A1C7NTS0_9HYPH|nr:VOC family protein [Pararhizobium polonicum]OBZ92397.1 lactoylglutathione lyase [Pararhizobium polonicum]
MSVISHITLGTNDKERSAKFYDAVLGAIGFSRLPKPAEKPLAYEKNGQMPTIYIYTPEDGRPATWGNGTHVALIADTKAQVHRFHELALTLGGMDEGAPGPRTAYGPDYYAAYVRDPDGNKLQAVCYAEG